jgi:SAM-dependent methyltransferase
MFAARADRVLAFDVSESAIAEAQGRHGRPNLVYTFGDATSLPVPSGSVDTYVSLETIEHVDQVQTYLAEATRILKPGGQFICSTPNREVTNPGKGLDSRPANRFHLREYDFTEFRALLAAHFHSVRMYGMNPLPKWLPALLATLNRSGESHLPTRLHQAIKLCASPARSRRYHDVVEVSPRFKYEYLVAVARRGG